MEHSKVEWIARVQADASRVVDISKRVADDAAAIFEAYPDLGAFCCRDIVPSVNELSEAVVGRTLRSPRLGDVVVSAEEGLAAAEIAQNLILTTILTALSQQYDVRVDVAPGSLVLRAYEVAIDHEALEWSPFERLTLYIDPGSAEPQDLADLYSALSDLYRADGGQGLVFQEGESRVGTLEGVLA